MSGSTPGPSGPPSVPGIPAPPEPYIPTRTMLMGLINAISDANARHMPGRHQRTVDAGKMALRTAHRPDRRSTRSMRSSHSLDRLDTAFDDDRLVPDAGPHPARHAGPSPRSQGARGRAPRPGREARPGERRRQGPDARDVGARGWRPHRPRERAARRRHRDGCWASGSRRPPPWARSCAASAGATCASSTRSAGSCWRGPGRQERVPATAP